MPLEFGLAELTETFRRLGAPDPAGWASSQIAEGIPQLGRFIFLRNAWRNVVSDANDDWIKDQLQLNPVGPGGAIVDALQAFLAGSASSRDLTTIVRVMQWHLLASLCTEIDQGGATEWEDGFDLDWALFQLDEDGRPFKVINGLIESVLETEPNGNEMMPSDSL